MTLREGFILKKAGTVVVLVIVIAAGALFLTGVLKVGRFGTRFILQ